MGRFQASHHVPVAQVKLLLPPDFEAQTVEAQDMAPTFHPLDIAALTLWSCCAGQAAAASFAAQKGEG